MPWIINASLDDLIDRDPTAGDLVLDLPVDLRGQALGHPVVMEGQIGEVARGTHDACGHELVNAGSLQL